MQNYCNFKWQKWENMSPQSLCDRTWTNLNDGQGVEILLLISPLQKGTILPASSNVYSQVICSWKHSSLTCEPLFAALINSILIMHRKNLEEFSIYPSCVLCAYANLFYGFRVLPVVLQWNQGSYCNWVHLARGKVSFQRRRNYFTFPFISWWKITWDWKLIEDLFSGPMGMVKGLNAAENSHCWTRADKVQKQTSRSAKVPEMTKDLCNHVQMLRLALCELPP